MLNYEALTSLYDMAKYIEILDETFSKRLHYNQIFFNLKRDAKKKKVYLLEWGIESATY